MPQSLVERWIQSASNYIAERRAELGVALFVLPAVAVVLVLTEGVCMLASRFG
jgi:hypothetical protein